MVCFVFWMSLDTAGSHLPAPSTERASLVLTTAAQVTTAVPQVWTAHRPAHAHWQQAHQGDWQKQVDPLCRDPFLTPRPGVPQVSYTPLLQRTRTALQATRSYSTNAPVQRLRVGLRATHTQSASINVYCIQ